MDERPQSLARRYHVRSPSFFCFFFLFIVVKFFGYPVVNILCSVLYNVMLMSWGAGVQGWNPTEGTIERTSVARAHLSVEKRARLCTDWEG